MELFLITHIDSISCMLQYGIAHKSLSNSNRCYKNIRGESLINTREKRKINITNVGNNIIITNTADVIVKAIALSLKKTFAENYKLYFNVCKNKEIDLDKPFVTREKTLIREKVIINFPTKTDWRKSSEYEYIGKDPYFLISLIRVIKGYDIKSITVPPLSAGNGGFLWEKVKKIIEDKLSNLKIDIYIYESTNEIKEKLKKERVKLTPAMALTLYIAYNFVSHLYAIDWIMQVRKKDDVNKIKGELKIGAIKNVCLKSIFELTFKSIQYI